jgi:uncharacterized lipoprotein
MVMNKKALSGLCCLILAACSPLADKYRDTKHLELPPTLVIDHVSNPSSRESGTRSDENSDLERLIMIVGSEDKPRLQLKAGFDRTWDLVDKAIKSAELEVVDKNHDAGSVRVHYVVDTQANAKSSLFSLFSRDSKPEYLIQVDKDKRTTEVHVDKAISAEQAQDNASSDDSASLVRLLHKTIITSLEK